MEVGLILDGVVTNITRFGAFVTLPDGQKGMVHISEIDDAYVQDINEFLKVDESVKVKITGVDEHGRINLSIRQAKPVQAEAPAPKPRPQAQQSESFEGLMSRFMKDSEDRLLDVRRNLKQKRGSHDRRG